MPTLPRAKPRCRVRGSRELSDQFAHAREDAGYGHHDHAFDAVPLAPAQVEFVAQYARTIARTVKDDPRCGAGLDCRGLKLNVGRYEGLKNL
jgi:hypothetical protein